MSGKTNIIEIKIESVAFGGAGVGRVGGKVCFVAGALPGETVRAAVAAEKKDYLSAEAVSALEPSESRESPLCPFARRLSDGRADAGPRPVCPGCAYQHVRYADEVGFKQSQFASMIRRVCGEDFPVGEPTPSPEPFFYRNKAVLHFSSEGTSRSLGYFLEDNRTVLDIPSCPLARREINTALAERRADPGFFHTLKDGMSATFRTHSGGTVFWRGSPPKGMSWLRDSTPFGEMAVPAGSFSQVNPGCAGLLAEKVHQIARESAPDVFVDLYCGAGFFSMAAAAAGVGKIIGVESDAASIEAARHNLKTRGDATFVAGDAGRVLRDKKSRLDSGRSLLLLDPPRGGLGRSAIEAVLSFRPFRMVYVSCAPDTLCRDLATILSSKKYRVVSAGVFDMFPRTGHFESMVVLEELA